MLVATDRPIGFWEIASGSRTQDYPFTIIELHIKPNGEGEGKISLATRVMASGNTIVLENYDAQPVLLTDVKEDSR